MLKKYAGVLVSVVFFIGLASTLRCGNGAKSGPTLPQLHGANGYVLSPAGVQIGADRKSIPMPSEIAVTPDGKVALVLSTEWLNYSARSHMITAIDTATDAIASAISLTTPPLGYESFDGMAINGSGTDVYVPGIDAQRGFALDIGIDAGENLGFKKAIPLQPYTTSTFGPPMQVWPTAAGIAVNGNTLITANDVAYDVYGNQYPGETVSIIDLSKATQTFTLTTGGFYPWAVAIAPDGNTAYVCNRQSDTGLGTVSVLSLGSTPAVTAVIPLQQAGSAAILSSLDGSKMYVANTLSDTVSVLDTSSNTIFDTISLAMFDSEPSMGGLPNNLALSGDGRHLYVSMGADNAIAVIDTATDQVVGRIPTASYPSGVAVDNANGHIFVANMYGIEHGPFVPANTGEALDFSRYAWFVFGSVSDVPQPSAPQLAAYTSQVLTNDFVKPAHPAVPANILSAWAHIKHIVYILRENKTFDMEFGDLGPRASGQPIPCPFFAPASISVLSGLPVSYGCSSEGIGFTTPNTHALAGQFALDTNFYLDIVPSIAGHPMSFQGMISDYLQRIWAINTGYGGENRQGDSEEPIASVPSGTIFDALKKAGLTFSSFGQGLPSLYDGAFNSDNPLNSSPEFDKTYGGLISDVVRAGYFVSAFNAMAQDDSFPNFVFMTLGEDGFEPTDTPTSAYSENDAATAAVVQAISNSKYWGSTAIFIDEDDPQPGIDHIDQERSFIVVISPYAKHGYISSAHYGFASALRTIELILGQSTGKAIPPMTEFDATALPMYDMFQSSPVTTPYTALPVTWPTQGPWRR
ncbi:MAG: bifunctional YncE family protein/alkaline phosphatase family protein [Deltaproteobacteria bacterium]|nr:bifunctional YncE family protein/alkaline phosphatase family protein [Deltaproteobacteria bacterium]MCL5277169.1 bifunctional YncE family protein/alkaline phosphatase family protein [Deltaproteobacteria bacterium]